MEHAPPAENTLSGKGAIDAEGDTNFRLQYRRTTHWLINAAVLILLLMTISIRLGFESIIPSTPNRDSASEGPSATLKQNRFPVVDPSRKSINISYYMGTVRNITTAGFGGFTQHSMLRASFRTEVYPPRLKNIIELLLGKERPITVLALGGSITAGNTNCCGHLPEGTSWPSRFQEWLNSAFPSDAGRHTVVNRAKGATGSDYIVTNFNSLIEGHQFDLVILDTACNDMVTVQGQTHMKVRVATEKIVRLFREHLPDAEVLYLELFPGDPGQWAGKLLYDVDGIADADQLHGYLTAQDDHHQVLAHYGVPSLSLRDALFPEMHSWRTESGHEWHLSAWIAGRNEGSRVPDFFHPNVQGHSRIAQFLAHYIVLIASFGDFDMGLLSEPVTRLAVPLIISPDEAKALVSPAKSRLDFGESSCDDAVVVYRVIGQEPIEQQLGWHWYADSKEKYGWIITRSAANSSIDGISFRFETGKVGSVTIGYLRSYSLSMGAANVSISCHGSTTTTILNGAWDNQLSLYQESSIQGLPLSANCMALVRLLPRPILVVDPAHSAKFKLLLLISH